MIPIPIAQPIQWQPSYIRKIAASTKNELRRVWNNLGWISLLKSPSFNLLFASFFPIFCSSNFPNHQSVTPMVFIDLTTKCFFSFLSFLVVNCCFPGWLTPRRMFCFRKKRNLKSGLECSSARFNFLFTKNTKREIMYFFYWNEPSACFWPHSHIMCLIWADVSAAGQIVQ